MKIIESITNALVYFIIRGYTHYDCYIHYS